MQSMYIFKGFRRVHPPLFTVGKITNDDHESVTADPRDQV